MGKTQFIKAWELEVGDTIIVRHEAKSPEGVSYREGKRVVVVHRQTFEGKAPGQPNGAGWRSNVVLIGTFGSYSPRWEARNGGDTVEIEARS